MSRRLRCFFSYLLVIFMAALSIARAQSLPSPSPPATSGDDEIVLVETNLVALPFSATDKNRRYVTTLRPEDIRVYEDDVPQAVSIFQRETDLPLALAILIDTSVSQSETLPDEKDAARDFIDAVVRPPRDQAAVLSFHTEATVEQDLTDDTAALHRAIRQIAMPRIWTDKEQLEFVLAAEARGEDGRSARYRTPGWSAIWDAVWATANEIMGQAPERARRAIILLSDGDENFNSPLKKDDVIEAALKNDTVIYCVGIGSEVLDKGALEKIAERTGGRAFFPENERQLIAAFAQIQQELRSQYLVAYSPTNKARDNSYRKLRLEIVNSELRQEKIKLSYRQGYFARAPLRSPAPSSGSERRTLAKPPRKRKK